MNYNIYISKFQLNGTLDEKKNIPSFFKFDDPDYSAKINFDSRLIKGEVTFDFENSKIVLKEYGVDAFSAQFLKGIEDLLKNPADKIFISSTTGSGGVQIEFFNKSQIYIRDENIEILVNRTAFFNEILNKCDLFFRWLYKHNLHEDDKWIFETYIPEIRQLNEQNIT